MSIEKTRPMIELFKIWVAWNLSKYNLRTMRQIILFQFLWLCLDYVSGMFLFFTYFAQYFIFYYLTRASKWVLYLISFLFTLIFYFYRRRKTNYFNFYFWTALKISKITKNDLRGKKYFPDVFHDFIQWISNVILKSKQTTKIEYFPGSFFFLPYYFYLFPYLR